MNQTYEFTLPASGKKVAWQSLTVGQVTHLSAAYAGQAQAGALTNALYRERIKSVDGVPGQPSIGVVNEWDADDWSMFIEEVDQRESARRALLRKQRATTAPLEELKSAVETLEAQLGQLARTLKVVYDTAEAAAHSADPLGSPPA